MRSVSHLAPTCLGLSTTRKRLLQLEAALKKRWVRVGDQLQVVIASGPASAAEANGMFPAESDLHFRASGRRRLDS